MGMPNLAIECVDTHRADRHAPDDSAAAFDVQRAGARKDEMM
jgi:hypothetical protein